MESVLGKAIDLVCEYTVVPIVRQLKYVFLYKSCVVEMNDAIGKLKNEKEIVDQQKSAAMNNGELIFKKADEWLDEVTKAQVEVNSLITYQEEKANGCIIGGQILNPIARHKLGRNATKKKLAIENICRDRPRSEEIAHLPPAPGIVGGVVRAKQQTDMFETSGWEHTLAKIMTSLKDDRINVIGLHGMGGVGKTTMVKKVRLQVFEQRLFDEVAEAKVTKDPEIVRIQEEIACELGLTLVDKWPTPRGNRLRERLFKNKDEQKEEEKKKKKKKTVLIILDDLWDKLELQDVGIPSSNDQVQIKLLLTSRYENVFSNEMAADHNIHLDALNEKEAWEMFSSAVGKTKVESIKKETATEIARRCGGLPLAIMAIAKALKTKDPKAWEDTLISLDPNNVLKNLEESYKYLANDDGSQDLFLLCGITRGPRILISDLLKYTLGLRLYNRKDGSTLITAATKLKKMLSSLEAASMLVKSDDTRYVIIHDLMRELAVKIVDKNRKEWVYDLVLSGNDICDDASELKLLLSNGEGDSVQVPYSFFKDMNKLYVLEFTNLRGALSLSSSPTQLSLEKLGTLCLHNCRLDDDIFMIGELKGLQILSFHGSDICKLPIQLQGLIALKMLDLSNCKELTLIEPNVLGSLITLEELNMENSFKDWEIDQEVDARPPTNARLIELKNMSRLSNVRMHIPSTSMLPKDDKLFFHRLNIYMIMIGGVWSWETEAERNESRVLMLEFDDSPDVLQQDWVQDTLQRTEVLHLSGCLDEKCESVTELCIKEFECLKHLRMSNCPSIRYIDSTNRGSCLMNLESLSLEDLENLEYLYNGLPRGETFSKLKVTKVKKCNKLTYLFDFSLLECNPELEEIIIKSCSQIRYCIVTDKDDKEDDVLEFSKLRKLKLQSLSQFSSFCEPKGPQPPTKALFSGKKVTFPCLESLIIDGLDELEDIWHLTDPPIKFDKLRSLDVQSCKNLVRAINSNVLTVNLESLTIGYCISMKLVFDLRNDQLLGIGGGFELLKKIHIFACSNMEAIVVVMMGEVEEIHQQVVPIQYSSLKELEVLQCSMLKTFCWYDSYSGGKNMVTSIDDNIIRTSEQVPLDLAFFTPKVTFPCLESLVIYSLDELQHIWHPTDPPIELSNLRLLSVETCNKLVTVINSNVLTVNLETLSIVYCDSVNHVFDLRYDHLLPRVGGFQISKNIKIWKCKKMVTIVAMMMIGVEKVRHQQVAAIQFSSLQKLKVMECPQLKTFCLYSSCGGRSDNNMVVAASSTTEDNVISISDQIPTDSSFFSHKCTATTEIIKSTSQESSSGSAQFPSLEILKMSLCPEVEALFIQRWSPAAGLAARSDIDDDLYSNTIVQTAFFGYCDKLDKSIPNLMTLKLSFLENFTGIWKNGESDNEISCSNRVLALQQQEFMENGDQFSMRKLESLYLGGGSGKAKVEHFHFR